MDNTYKTAAYLREDGVCIVTADYGYTYLTKKKVCELKNMSEIKACESYFEEDILKKLF